MLKLRKHSILFIILLFLIARLNAQETNHAKIFWIKESQIIQPNGFFFNVLRIENKSTNTLDFQLKLELPEDGKLITQLPEKITIEADAAKSIPVRYFPPKVFKVDSSYFVKAHITSENINTQASTEFKIEGIHKVQLVFAENSIIFQPGENEAFLKFQIKNEGNYTEQITLELDLSNELNLTDRSQKTFSVQIIQGAVIEKEIAVKYKSNTQSPFSTEGWITIDMINGEERTSKRISAVRLNNVYDNFGTRPIQADNRIEYYLSQRDGFGFSSNILAEGGINTSKGRLIYGMQLRDVFNQSTYSFLENNFFELSYYSDAISYGLGTSTFQGLTGLYKRNSLFVDKAFRINDKNRIRFFANESINQFNLGLAAGHEFITKNIVTQNSAGWNTNNELKTKSFLLENSSSFYFGPLSAFYRGNYTNVSGENDLFDESTYSHTLKMDGNFFNKTLNFDLSHRYLDSDKKNNLQEASYLYSNLRYLLNEKGLQAMIRYSNSSVKQDMLFRNSKTSSNIIRSQMIFPLQTRVKLTSGLQLSEYKNEIYDTYLFKEKSVNLFSDLRYSFAKFAGRSSLRYGLKSLNDSDGAKSFWGANTELEYQPVENSNFFVELNYSDGAALIYKAERQKEIEAQFGIKQGLPGGNRNYLILSAYYRDSPVNTLSPLSMKAGINLWTPGNININVNVGVKSNVITKKVNVSNIEARVVKHFNWKNKNEEFFNLEMVFFKDDNGNSIADKEEERISGIKVMLTPLSTKGRTPNIASLVTANNGTIRYKNLAAGTYRLKYFPIVDLNGYFNFDESETTIELFNDQHLETGFSKAGKIHGTVMVNRAQFSSIGGIDISNIRITATSSTGKTYSTLTDKFGNFVIYLPRNQEYILSINNLFGSKFEIKQNNIPADLTQAESFEFNFEVNEKKRKINFGK